MRAEQLILVDEGNRAIGRAGKETVHRLGRLHRAFSIFLVDADGRLLLQRRSEAKYHSAGLWANSCCGHPRPGESTLDAARRRLGEEIGVHGVRLRYAFRARYCTELPNGLIENEIVYVYFGVIHRDRISPRLNPAEVSALGWSSLRELQSDVARHPRRYAYWLRYYLKNHAAAIRRAIAATRGSPGKKAL